LSHNQFIDKNLNEKLFFAPTSEIQTYPFKTSKVKIKIILSLPKQTFLTPKGAFYLILPKVNAEPSQ
jgi:hypothetical protein